FLKEKNRNVRIVLADPHGSALYSWAKTGELTAEGSSITEGIGTTRITANFEGTPVDDAERIGDRETVAMVYRLLREEGLCVGGARPASTWRRPSRRRASSAPGTPSSPSSPTGGRSISNVFSTRP